MRSIPFSPGLEFLRFLLEITSAGQNDQYLHITVDHLDFRDYLNPPEVGHGDIKNDQIRGQFAQSQKVQEFKPVARFSNNLQISRSFENAFQSFSKQNMIIG